MAIGTGMGIALAAAAVAAGAIGTTMIATSAGGGEKAPELPAMPSAPGIQETEGEERRKLNQQRALQSNNMLTNPLAEKEDKETQKTLLGG